MIKELKVPFTSTCYALFVKDLGTLKISLCESTGNKTFSFNNTQLTEIKNFLRTKKSPVLTQFYGTVESEVYRFLAQSTVSPEEWCKNSQFSLAKKMEFSSKLGVIETNFMKRNINRQIEARSDKPISLPVSSINPAHYRDGGIDTIDFITAKNLNFNTGNAVKYISRAGKKDPSKHLEDLQKAKWYIEHEIKKLEDEKAAS